MWIAAGERFILESRDRWSVYPAPATVNKLAVDGVVLWIATDDGVVRFDTGTQLASRITMDDGLPSQAVSAVAVDEQYVWFGTNKGLVRYRKLDRSFRSYTEQDGLPDAAINDVLTVGRQIWVGTRAGLAVYDPDVDGLRAFGRADGLAADEVSELFQVGDDLWCRTDSGLSRFRIKARAFTNFSFAEIGGEEIRAFAVDGERIWVGTEQGLFSFESSSDTFIPFPQQTALEGKSIAGIEPFTDYLFIVTDVEVLQFHKTSRAIRRYTEADGLLREAGAGGTLLQGGLLTVMFPDGAEVYDVQRDLWTSRTFEPSETEAAATRARVFGRLNAELPYDLLGRQLSPERFATAEAGFGIGHRFEDGRSLDTSARLDYGQLELKGIRSLEYELEYLGTKTDALREVRAGDQQEYRTREEGLERTLLLQGAHARVATPGDEPAAQATVDFGLRRGGVVRDFLTGKRQDVYALSKHYVLPGTERVWLDGELLTAGTDYTLIYPAGQLFFLDPERVDDLSVIEVEYEYDLMPKKGLGVLSLLDLLPADREVGDWSLAGAARMISEESGLYQQIDGAAPKYIDRGWVRSVYAEYRQGGRTIQVAIHDLGTEANAQGLFDFDLPPAREPVADRDNLVIDVGLASSYATKAWTGSFFLELSIDEKSDAAKQSLKLFSIQILDRGKSAGENSAGADEILAAARVALTPAQGMEVGARIVEVRGLSSLVEGERARRLFISAADLRYEREVLEGGRVTAYGEIAGSDGENPGDRDGWATMGRLRFSHPSLEGLVSGRHDSTGYTPIGTSDRLLGKLRDEARAQATGYPARWLPLSAFFSREIATDPVTGETGSVQHLLGRVQLTADGLPAASFQAGYSTVNGLAQDVGRAKLIGQAEYDLAQSVLAFTGMKRFWLRGLYGLSEAESDERGAFQRADRVQQGRVEAKIAPTTNESAYALFRARTVERQSIEGGESELLIGHWELSSGARSASIPGLIPQLNYTLLFDDDRTLVALESSKGSAAVTLGVYPGQWWPALAALVIEPRYSLGHDEQAQGGLKVLDANTHRIDTRLVWASGGTWDFEVYQLVELLLAGPEQQTDARKLELRGRVVYRPVYWSPITARFTHLGLAARNDPLIIPDAPEWGTQDSDEGALEWLMRWSALFTSRLRASYVLGRVADWMMVTPESAGLQSFVQHQVAGETELRFFPLESAAELFIAQRNRLARLFGEAGATNAWAYDVAAAVIWSVADKLYLESEIAWRKTACLDSMCAPSEILQPRLFLTVNL